MNNTYEAGAILGGYLAGSAGALIGTLNNELLCASFLTSSEFTQTQLNVLPSDIILDRIKIIVQACSPVQCTTISKTFHDALCFSLEEAIYDVGGSGARQCFMEKSTRLGGPVPAVYPLAGGRNLWHTRDPRAAQACECLRELLRSLNAGEIFLFQSRHQDMQIENPYQYARTPIQIADAFYNSLIRSHIKHEAKDIPGFEIHLRRWLFKRTWFHLGNFLSSQEHVLAWRIFNRLLLNVYTQGLCFQNIPSLQISIEDLSTQFRDFAILIQDLQDSSLDNGFQHILSLL